MSLEYKGFQEVVLSSDEMSDFYSDLSVNRFGCLNNEYIIINDENNTTVDFYRWNGSKHDRVTKKQIETEWLGKIKPRNSQQVLAIDMLMNADITVKVLTGKYGAGKDFLMIASALELIKKHKYDKIVWVRNNIGVKNTKDLGALPGTDYEKLLPFVMPLADHVGGINGLEMLIHHRKVEVVHLGFIRGRDIKDSIIYVTESENTTREHIKLLLGRVGEGSALWLNGDYQQTDDKVFENDNGLLTAIDRLKGHHMFGFVYMPKTERSKTAALADLLD